MLKKEKAAFYVLFKTSEGSCTHEGTDLIMSQAGFPAKGRQRIGQETLILAYCFYITRNSKDSKRFGFDCNSI